MERFSKKFRIPISIALSTVPSNLSVSLELNSWSTDGFGSSVGGFLYGDIGLQLTAAPTSFRPRDASEANAISGCDSNAGHCEPEFTAKFMIEGIPVAEAGIDDLSGGVGKIKFSLSGVSNLLGTSTNKGSSTDPDYRFDTLTGFATPTTGGATIQTSNLVTEATAKVTSLDYGGTARLTAYIITPSNGEIEIDAVVNDQGDPVAVPGCVQSPPSFKFAQLPRDTDCNAIADKWEDDNSTQGGSHLAANWDAEPGPTGSVKTGDGFTVNDEYRGFHYLDEGENDRWASTNPLAAQDVFFVDAVGTQAYGVTVTDAIANLLASQTPFITYRPVSLELGNALNPEQPGQGMGRFNKNSSGSMDAFAFLYLAATCEACTTLGDAQTTGNSGTPIKIYPTSITNLSNEDTFPSDVLATQVVTHETGHRFGLRHYSREASPIFSGSPNTTQYRRNVVLNDTVLTTFNIFHSAGEPYRCDRVDTATPLTSTGANGVFGNQVYSYDWASPGPGSGDSIAQVNIRFSETVYLADMIFEEQRLLIMDWAPRTKQPSPAPQGEPNLRILSGWSFAATDLLAICAKCQEQ